MPRRILPNTTYLVTRRCTQRQFLLAPSGELNRLFVYAVGVAIAKTKVTLHAIVVMSNHWHAVVTDPHGNLPLFLAEVHRTVARARNAMLGRTENLWSNEQSNLMQLPQRDDIIDRIAYVIANPVAAGAVGDPSQWPGLLSAQFGAVFEATRPEEFFRQNGPMPEKASFTITAPDVQLEGGVEELNRLIAEAVAVKIGEARERLAQGKRAFAGAEACEKQSSDRKAATREALGQRIPKVGCACPQKRMEIIEELREWLRAYREAWCSWKRGLRDTVFPHGTYQLRLHAAVECGPPKEAVG